MTFKTVPKTRLALNLFRLLLLCWVQCQVNNTKVKEMNKRKKNTIGIIILVALLTVGVVGKVRKLYFKSLPQNYAIGQVNRFIKVRKQGRKVEIIYSVNYEKYRFTLFEDTFSELPMLGDKYIVAYPEKFKGKYGRIFLDKRINTSVEQPLDGWDKPPKVSFENY